MELKATVAKGFRNPTLREMYMFPPQNPDLQPERVVNYEIAFSQRFPQQRLSYGLNLFYLHGNNLIQTVRVPNGMLNINTGEVDNAGIEVEAGWQISPSWNVAVQYSWLHMKRPILASPEHKACASISYSSRRWSVSTDWQYVHGLYTALDSRQQEKFLLWNARVDYQIYHFLRIFAKGEICWPNDTKSTKAIPCPKRPAWEVSIFNFKII